jgi:hypothetical protein
LYLRLHHRRTHRRYMWVREALVLAS